MNKSEYRAWRRKLRKERRAQLAELRSYNSRHGGTYNNNQLITSYTLPYSATQPRYLYDKKSVSKSPKKGDFIHTTDYAKHVQESKGQCFLGFSWRYDKGTTHTKGKASLGAYTSGTGPTWYGGYAETTSMRAGLLAAAQSALNAKVLNDFPSWDILTDAGELKETIGFFGSLATSLKEVAIGVFTRNPKRVLRGFGVSATQRKVRHVKRVIQDAYLLGNTGHQTYSAIANLWMSYRYGLMPVIYSMQDAMIALCAPENDREYLSTAQVTLSDTKFLPSKTVNTSNVAYASYNAHHNISCTGSIRMKSYHRYTTGVKARLLANPWKSTLSTAYELITLSFVLDWFYDIGSWLQSLQLSDIVAESWVNVTERGDTVEHGYFTDLVLRPHYTVGMEYCPGLLWTGKYFYFKRWKGSLSAQAPSLEFGLSNFKRQLDSLALGWGTTRRLMRHPLSI